MAGDSKFRNVLRRGVQSVMKDPGNRAITVPDQRVVLVLVDDPSWELRSERDGSP